MGILSEKLNRKKLDDATINDIVEKIVKSIISVASPSKIYLFGSTSDGTATENSDFDIAVIFQDNNELKDQKKIILNSNLFKNIQVDLLFFTEKALMEKGKVGGVSFEILNKGRVIYDKKSKI